MRLTVLGATGGIGRLLLQQALVERLLEVEDRKSTRLNSSH